MPRRAFDPATYADFRDCTLKEAAMAFASSGSAAALRKLLQRHAYTLMPHLLEILSCFPETLPPKSYIDILPKAGCLKLPCVTHHLTLILKSRVGSNMFKRWCL